MSIRIRGCGILHRLFFHPLGNLTPIRLKPPYSPVSRPGTTIALCAEG